MKQLIIGFIAGGLAFWAFTTLSDQSSPSNTESHQTNRARSHSSSSSSAEATSHSISGGPSSVGNSRTSGKPSSIVSRLIKGEEISNNRDRSKLLVEIYGMNQRDIDQILKSPNISEVSHFDQANHAILNACFSRLAEVDPQQALQKALKLTDQSQRSAIYAVFQQWSENDPEGAWAYALEIEKPADRKLALSSALKGLANTQPDRAFALAKEHSNTDALYSILMVWGKQDPAAALAKCTDAGGHSEWGQQNIMKTWLNRDPDAAMAYAKALPSEAKRSQALANIITAMATKDTDQTYAMLEEYGSVLQDEHLNSLASELGRNDPHRALTWINGRANSEVKNNLHRNLISAWIRNDEEAALAYFQSIDDPALKKKTRKSILQNLSWNDPNKFFELYSGALKTNDSSSRWMLENAMERVTKSDPAKAQEYLTMIENPEARNRALKGIAVALAATDVDSALKLVEQLTNPREHAAALGSIYQSQAKKNPAGVAEHFLADGGIAKIGDFGIYNLVSTFAESDIDGAQEFVKKIEDPLIRDQAMRGMLNRWASNDPEAAWKYAHSQEPTQGIQSTMWSIGSKLAQKDPHKALEMATSGGHNTLNDNMIKAIFKEWAGTDPDAAAQGLSQLNYDDHVHKDVYANFGKEYANEPDKGVTWIEGINDENAKNYATTSFLDKWVFTEPNAATNWVKGLPEGSHRDTAVKSLAYAFDNAEPDYALEWAATISNPDTRTEVLKKTYVNWQRRNRDKAQQWLRNSNLVTEDNRAEWSEVR